MTVRRECCNYCMWFGPVNQDGTMRKHRPATLEDQWGQPNKVQDMSADPCPGSNKPFATFGCDNVPDPNPLYQEAATVPETAAPRYITHSFLAGSHTIFAVKDTVTQIDVASFYSRYAARDKARRLNEAENAEASAEVAEILAQPSDRSKCAHGRHRYTSLSAKEIPRCETGARYGVWDDGAGGFTHVVDCAQDAATWAAEQLDDEPDGELEIKAVCPEHEEQPADSCEDCNAEADGEEPEDDEDA